MENFDLSLLEEFKDSDSEPVEEVPEIEEETPSTGDIPEIEKGVLDEPEEPVEVASKTSPVTQVREEKETEFPELTEREKVLLAQIEEIRGKQFEEIRPQSALELKEVAKNQHDFIGDGDIDEVLSSKENLNQLLQKVYERGLEEASKLSAENVMQSLPRVITQYISQHLEMRQTVDKFYGDNPDLAMVKKTVAAVANEIAGNNPDLTTEEVFKRTAQQTRTLLRLRQPTQPTKPIVKSSRPAFTGQKGRMKIPELDGLAKEIHELIEL